MAETSKLDEMFKDRYTGAKVSERMYNCAPNDTITPKLHKLMEHVLPFVKEQKTWAKTCEQSIEAISEIAIA
uniref:Uncharacterized protein n=1 Tax=Caenorhabditis japonica TaxID=281687 RepID=A0A8R1IWY5_CAEJA